MIPFPLLSSCVPSVASEQSSSGRGADRRGGLSTLRFVRKYARNHASPNSGYPESALAAILDCRFGGPHYYFGQLFDKPYIGTNDRPLTTADMQTAVRINRIAEVLMVLLTLSVCLFAFLSIPS